MTPKEKADELFRKMYQVRSVAASDITKHFAKQSALIAVDEIIKFMEMDDEHNECLYFANSKWVQYLIEVKQEIEKL
jgi:hypothetical protein